MEELSIPETFNVATAYVDANVEAGRGAETAFFYLDERITYQDVLENVNRTGNALQSLGVDVEQRVALLLRIYGPRETDSDGIGKIPEEQLPRIDRVQCN